VIRSIAIGVMLGWSLIAEAQSLLIENVRIFDGVTATLKPGHVLVDDGIITHVSTKKIDTTDDVKIIDLVNCAFSTRLNLVFRENNKQKGNDYEESNYRYARLATIKCQWICVG
jgi:hypothetical protein